MTTKVSLVAWSGDVSQLAARLGICEKALTTRLKVLAQTQSGRAEINAWLDKTGEPKAGLSVMVDEIATLKAKPKPQGGGAGRTRAAPITAPARGDRAQL